MESSASGKRKSVEVACEVNELWRADLRLHEQRLKVAWKQLAGQERLIGAVKMLTNALVHSGLVGRSSQGKAGASRSMWKGKGKGKGRADVEVSPEMSDEDADGEKDSSEDGEEEDD